jgi:hypothetical protein
MLKASLPIRQLLNRIPYLSAIELDLLMIKYFGKDYVLKSFIIKHYPLCKSRCFVFEINGQRIRLNVFKKKEFIYFEKMENWHKYILDRNIIEFSDIDFYYIHSNFSLEDIREASKITDSFTLWFNTPFEEMSIDYLKNALKYCFRKGNSYRPIIPYLQRELTKKIQNS